MVPIVAPQNKKIRGGTVRGNSVPWWCEESHRHESIYKIAALPLNCAAQWNQRHIAAELESRFNLKEALRLGMLTTVVPNKFP